MERSNQKKYDLIVVGAGLYGATVAQKATERGLKVLVMEKEDDVGGMARDSEYGGIRVHRYGAHIFHTDNEKVWRYANRFSGFNHYIHMPVARYMNEIYSLPFNMHTFREIYGVSRPQEVRDILKKAQSESDGEADNLRDFATRQVGKKMFTKLIRGYTEKQWGRPCEELPASILKRIPIRFTYDNRYFTDAFQGIPINGYTEMIREMLCKTITLTGINFLDDKEKYSQMAARILYTGPIDAWFDYQLGALEYRTVRFSHILVHTDNYQGCAVVNHTDPFTPYTRVIEHKWFNGGKGIDGKPTDCTVISEEYSVEWQKGMTPYYPITDEKNLKLYQQYRKMAGQQENVYFGGRLGDYAYYNMDQTIEKALRMTETICADIEHARKGEEDR